jgi:DNA invertase Pin-like site-specific DNA recombinase
VRAAVYARVSSAGQRDSDTIASQLRDLPAFVAAQGWTLAGTYVDDGKSAGTGKLGARGGFAELARAAERGEMDVVVVRHIDRLTRTDDMRERAEILGAFQRAGVSVATPGGGMFDLRSMLGELYVTLHAMFAAEERRKIVERTLAGKHVAATRGAKVSGPTPFGLRYDRNAKAWSVNELEAPIAAEVLQRIVDGESCAAIAAELDARNAPRLAKQPWTRSRVWDLAASRHLIGEYSAYRSKGIKISVPPVVDVALFEAAQLALRSRRPHGLRRTKYVYLAEAIGACGYCGAPMRIRSGHAQSTNRYVCANRRRGGSCSAPTWPIVDADARVWEVLCAKVADPSLLPLIAAETDARSRDVHDWAGDAAGYEKHIGRLERHIETVLQRARRGAITENQLDRELAATNRELAAVREQLATAERAQLLKSGAKRRLRAAGALVEGLRAQMADATTPAERRAIVTTLVDAGGVTFGPDGEIVVDFMLPLVEDDAVLVHGNRRESGHESRVKIRAVG